MHVSINLHHEPSGSSPVIRFFSDFFLFVLCPRSGHRITIRLILMQTAGRLMKKSLSLKLNTGKQILEAEKKAHPNNLIPYFLDNYIDFFTLYFNEDPAEYQRRKPSSGSTSGPDEKGRSVFSVLSVYPLCYLFPMGCSGHKIRRTLGCCLVFPKIFSDRE